MSHYNNNLDKNNANYIPLTPITFLERTKDIYPNYEALIYKNRSYTWREVYDRSILFASSLEKSGIKQRHSIYNLSTELFEAHYSVPMTGAILNTINTRLDSKTVSYILKHADAKHLLLIGNFLLC